MFFLGFQLLLGLLHPYPSRCGKEDIVSRRGVILSSLEEAMLFLEKHYEDINLDAVFGYNFLRGIMTKYPEADLEMLVDQFHSILSDLSRAYLNATLGKWDSKVGPSLEWDRVARLEAKVSALIEKAKPAVEQKDPHYYKVFTPALAPGFWKMPHGWTRLNPSIDWVPTNGSCLTMEESDGCISAILGTLQSGHESCLVPESCRESETQTHCSDYSLSHQLLYFLFAEMQRCSDPIFLNAPYYKNVFCHSMMQSNLKDEQPASLQLWADIFTENILFCGIAGFSDFYKPEWLDLILSWQKPGKGCFWMYEPSAPVPEQPVPKRRRVKRKEEIIQDECSSHNTAVAVGAIGGYFYYSF